MDETRLPFTAYGDDKRREVLERLAANEGNVAKTAHETGVREGTIRRWRDAALGKPGREHGARGASRRSGAGDLKKFSRDSWDIIHKANEVVKDGIEEMAPKDAASIAAGYFDRQAKAQERLEQDGTGAQEYAAEWDGKK